MASNLAAACTVTILGLLVLELAFPFWGAFAVGAVLSYVATDLLVGLFVQLGPNWVKVIGGRNLFTTKANAFWALLIFVVVISPLVSFLTDYVLPALRDIFPDPAVLVPLVVATLPVAALVTDLLWRTRPR
jgi:hypothetical protein